MNTQSDALTEDRKPPRPVVYKIQIDKDHYETSNPTPTGRELLLLAKKLPPEQFAIYIKPRGSQPVRVGLDEKVDLRQPGVERFVTLPLDQTEGLGSRREFSLPEEDTMWLEESGLNYELVREGSTLRVVLYGFPVPSGYNERTVDAYVRIDPGYPDNQIDMVYFHPALRLTSGRSIGALSDDSFDGKTWQRWSRHRTPANPWRPGLDCLATHFALVQSWLERELKGR